MDEKALLLGQALKVKVIVLLRQRKSRYCQDGNPEMVTDIENVSPHGLVLPPIFVHKDSVRLMGWYARDKKQEKAIFARSQNGWTDQEPGLEWVEQNLHHFCRSNMYISSSWIKTILLIASNSQTWWWAPPANSGCPCFPLCFWVLPELFGQ